MITNIDENKRELDSVQLSHVLVDPSCRMLYASFYLYGIKELIGKERIKFQSQPFNQLQKTTGSDKYERYLAIVVVYQNRCQVKVIIDYHDDNAIDNEALEWCDIYGKTNYPIDISRLYPYSKVIPIAPGFGIKYFTNYCDIFTTGLSNYFKAKESSGTSAHKFFAGYFSRKRVGMELYKPTHDTEEDYVFYISSLWNHKFCVENTNPWRFKFMTTCKNEIEGLTFEGGFLVGNNAKGDTSEMFKYSEFIIRKPILNKYYISKVKKSFVVFNTPAVHGCHGWKLGEYLALGKAIISTPLKNGLPAPLSHGENVHFVKKYDELKDAILKIKGDHNYRRKLEKGAYEYFSRYINPSQIVSLLLASKV